MGWGGALSEPRQLPPRPAPRASGLCDARGPANVRLCEPSGLLERWASRRDCGRGRGLQGPAGARAWPVGRADAKGRHHPTGVRPPPPFSGDMWAGRRRAEPSARGNPVRAPGRRRTRGGSPRARPRPRPGARSLRGAGGAARAPLGVAVLSCFFHRLIAIITFPRTTQSHYNSKDSESI